MSRYLIRPKPQEQLRSRVKEMASAKAPHNIIKVIRRSSIGSSAHLHIHCYLWWCTFAPQFPQLIPTLSEVENFNRNILLQFIMTM